MARPGSGSQSIDDFDDSERSGDEDLEDDEDENSPDMLPVKASKQGTFSDFLNEYDTMAAEKQLEKSKKRKSVKSQQIPSLKQTGSLSNGKGGLRVRGQEVVSDSDKSGTSSLGTQQTSGAGTTLRSETAGLANNSFFVCFLFVKNH